MNPHALPRTSPNLHWRIATIAGALALVLWVAWWAKTRHDGKLYGAKFLWVPALEFLGGDFVVHIDHTARVWASGESPYRLGDPVCSIFPYPPMIPRLFSWVVPFSTATARDIWMTVLSAILAFGGVLAVKTRRNLNLTPIPIPLAIAAILISTPAIFAVERGQCDAVVIILAALSAFLLARNTAPSEILAGCVIALACWIKYYPGLMLVGLVALKRWKALVACCVVGALLGCYDFRWVMRSLENCNVVLGQFAPGRTWVLSVDHSLSYGWKSLWRWTILKPLSRIPGTPATLLVLGPIIAIVAHRIWLLPRDAANRVMFPLMIWLVAVATFFPPIANDYNLVFLPLAALALYDPRDRPIVHMCAAYLLLWWQPFKLPISGGFLLACKVAGCWGVGLSLATRCREIASAACMAEFAIPRPHRTSTQLASSLSTRPS